MGTDPPSSGGDLAYGEHVDLDALRGRVVGPTLMPGDDGFRDELLGQNLYLVHTPQLVVGATSAQDVQAAVRYAAEHGLRVSVLATGHGIHATITDGMVITTRRLDEVSVDLTTRTASIGGGVRASRLIEAASEHGLAPVTGSSGTVGLTGLVLGGGPGPLARSYGYASDYVLGFTVVTSDGQIVLTNVDENPDLFWALRGGKAGFGIVVETRLRLVELGTIFGGSVAFAEADMDSVLRGWIDWTHDAPSDVTTSVAITRSPSSDRVAEGVRGRTLLLMRFAYPGDIRDGRRHAAPLLALAPQLFGHFDTMPASDIGAIHADPVDPGYSWVDGTFLQSIDANFATTLLERAGADRRSPFLKVEIRQLGGATTIDVPEGSSAGGRSSRFALNLIGTPDPALFTHRLPVAANELLDSIRPHVARENNINWWFGKRSEDFKKSWSPAAYQRLDRLRSQWDPSGVFQAGPLAP